MNRFLIVGALLLIPAIAVADPVNQVSPSSLTTTKSVTFDDIVGGLPPGTNYDSYFVSQGVGFDEHFVGQTMSTLSDFDVISGAPVGPLTLANGPAGQNLDVVAYDPTAVLAGIGPVGYPQNDGIGEGAMSILFSSDQSQFGFDLVGGDGGQAFVSFYGADGTLIQEITLSNLSDQSYAFATDGGVKDIRGISIYNEDEGGIGLDNLKFDVGSSLPRPPGGPGALPEPGAWALMILGFGLAGASLRRQRAIAVA